MSLSIDVPEQPSDADREAVLAVLRAYNESQAGAAKARPVAILLKDDRGDTAGGLWGRTGYEWMFVEYLAVPEGARHQGRGSALMREAERIARERGCRGIWLDTFSFQARGFYERLGYSLFGTLDDYPAGEQRFFLAKRLNAEP